MSNSGNNSGSPQGGPPTNAALQYFQQWSEKTPFLTRNTTVALVALYLATFFIPADRYLGNVTYFTLYHFEVYRVVLSPLVGNSFLTVLLLLFTFPNTGSRFEWSLGSLGFLFLMGTLSLLTNLLFNFTCFFLYVAGTPEALFWGCSGFWVTLFALVTIECMQTPDTPRRLFLIPMDIPSKYMPLILYAMFSLFGGPQLDFALAILLGYLYSQGYCDRLKPSSYYLGELEAPGGTYHNISRNPGWVLSGSAQGQEAWLPVNAAAVNADNADANSNSSGGLGAFYGNRATPSAPPDPRDQFPGSGRKLTPTTGVGNIFSGNSGSGTGSREEMAARRLAALSNQNINGQV